ncbi:MAG: hypothetical protein O7I42_22000 [Alphaproteobacteria bacterium]|nr:hypothetical protein [Alphaproteobacteria bacterium]
MHIRSISILAAVVLASTAGAASAAERFSVLDGVAAEPLTAHEMDIVQGTAVFSIVNMSGFKDLTLTSFGFSILFFQHGGCPAPETCGVGGKLTGDPLPRGF